LPGLHASFANDILGFSFIDIAEILEKNGLPRRLYNDLRDDLKDRFEDYIVD